MEFMIIAGSEGNDIKLSVAAGALLDDLVGSAIEATPTANDLQLISIQRRRKRILREARSLFSPFDVERGAHVYKLLTIAIWVICFGSIAFVLYSGHGRISVISQILVAYLVALFVGWCLHYCSILLQHLSFRMHFRLLAGVGIIGFSSTLFWWLSPFSPIHPQPEVVANIQPIDSHMGKSSGVMLSGTALLAPNTDLWILTRQQDRSWPVTRVEIDRRTGQWNAQVPSEYLSGRNEPFTIATVVVPRKESKQLENYLSMSHQIGIVPPIVMPAGSNVQKEFDFDTSPAPNRRTVPTPSPSPASSSSSPKHYPHGGGWNTPLMVDMAHYLDPDQRVSLQRQVKTVSEQIDEMPDDAGLYKKRAYLLTELGDQDGAERDFTQAILFTADAESFNGRGLAFLRKGRLEEAIEDFQIAARVEPSNTNFINNLYFAEDIQSNIEDVIGYLQATAAYRPADVEVKFRLGRVFKEHGDIELAKQAFAAIAKSNDNSLKKRALVELSALDAGK
jgi:hypothetical protein